MITLPFDPSPNKYNGRPDPIQCIVVHSTECPMTVGYAASLASPNWFGSTKAGTSAHAIFDPSGGVEMVKPGDTAWHVGTANQWTYGIEHCGYARFTRADWLTDDGKKELTYSGLWAAQIALAYNIPAVHLTNDQAAAGQKGFVTHNQCRLVWGGTTHTDPGDGWPWDYYLSVIDSAINSAKGSVAQTPGRKVDVYTVVAGDTLGAIAAKFGTTADALAKLNGIANPNAITIGQKIKLTADATTPEKEEDDDDMKYVLLGNYGGAVYVVDPYFKSKTPVKSGVDLTAIQKTFNDQGVKVEYVKFTDSQWAAIPTVKG